MDEFKDSIINLPEREAHSSDSNVEIGPVVPPENVTPNLKVLEVVQEDENARPGLHEEIVAFSNANSGLVNKNGYIITPTIEGVTPNPANSLANNLLAKISKI